MKRVRNWNLIIVPAAMLLIVAACSQKPVGPSGFLGDLGVYDQMTLNDRYQVKEYVPNPAVLSEYTTFIVPPIDVRFIDQRTREGVDQDEIEDLANTFRRKIILALGNQYSVVNQPMRNTAVLKVALTGITSSSALANLRPTKFVSTVGLGGAGMEAKLTDSVTGELIGAFMDSRHGDRSHYFNSMRRWGYTENVFEQWAANLKNRLRNAQG